MLKIILRTLIILLVAGLVAGGIYLFVQNGGVSLLGAGAGRDSGRGFSPDQSPGTLAGAAFAAGQRPASFDHGPEGQAGFSLAGLAGVAMQAGKIAVITALVVAVQSLARLFRRRRRVASSPAV